MTDIHQRFVRWFYVDPDEIRTECQDCGRPLAIGEILAGSSGCYESVEMGIAPERVLANREQELEELRNLADAQHEAILLGTEVVNGLRAKLEEATQTLKGLEEKLDDANGQEVHDLRNLLTAEQGYAAGLKQLAEQRLSERGKAERKLYHVLATLQEILNECT